MPDVLYNVLRESLFTVKLTSGEIQQLTLPQILSHLGENSILSFEALQAYQKHALHAFCVQLAALAFATDKQEEFTTPSTSSWMELLLALTDNKEEPWSLFVKELKQAALFQPPVPEHSLAVLKNREHAPDGIDILVTAKNHDLKSSRASNASPEHWFYALLTLQTMQGFSGNKNYGIARMNGGLSNRPCVSYTPTLELGTHFQHDLKILLQKRDELVREYGYKAQDGIKLLWLEPWDGKTSLALADCDPFFLEICRRIRLIEENDSLVAAIGNSNIERLSAKTSKGNIGDPWTPVSKEGNSLTVPGGGFSYPLVTDLLFGSNYKPAITQTLNQGDTSLFIARTLVRGQGVTEGYHERIVPIPRKVKRNFSSKANENREKTRLEKRAQRRIQAAEKVEKKVLKIALCALLQAGAESLDFRDDRAKPWIKRLDQEIDSIFFEELWKDVEELDDSQSDRNWEALICKLAYQQLQEAMKSVPLPSSRRYRALAAAEGMFHGCKRKQFPELFAKETPIETQGAV